MKKLVVITGASSGIGEAMAKQFSAAGYPLLLVARRIEKLTALNLPNCLCEQVDVTDKAAFEQAIAKAEAQYGPVECLINNAGVMLLGQIDTQDSNEWTKMFDVNVIALLGGMQAVLEPMKARQVEPSSILAQLQVRKHSQIMQPIAAPNLLFQQSVKMYVKKWQISGYE